MSLAALGVHQPAFAPGRILDRRFRGAGRAEQLGRWCTRRRALVAFGFGLIHGFGFASVLADLGLPQGALVLSLVGFNVGVELGQLAIVALFLPLAYLLRRSVSTGAW